MNATTVAVIGENLVDLFVDEVGAITPVPGGGPFNVARTISRLGQQVVLFSRVSSDDFGRVLQSTLADDGVTLAIPQPVDLPTSLAVVEVDDSGPRYKFHLNGTAAFQLEQREALDTFRAMADAVAVIYFGTLGLLVEPMATTGEALVMGASASTLVVLDPNCRPSAIIDPECYRQRLHHLFTRSDVVKVSTEDLAYLFPGKSPRDASGTIVDLGARCVIVTDGPDQVHVVSPAFEVSVDVPAVEVIDTVGAGDALVGGFISWWVGHGLGRSELADLGLVREGIEAAVVVSSSACTRQGADPPWAEQVRGVPGWKWL